MDQNKQKNMWMLARFPFPENVFEELNEHAYEKFHIKHELTNWDSLYSTNPKETSKHHPAIMNLEDFGIIDDMLKYKTRILEIGSWNSFIAYYLLLNGNPFYYGIEPSKEAIEFSEKKLSEVNDQVHFQFQQNTLENSTYEDNFFDYIISYDTFEHFKNPMTLLKKTYKWLKPGGITVLACPNASGFHPRFFGIYKWRMLFSTHAWLPDKETLFKAFEFCNLKIEKYFTFGGFKGPRNIIRGVGNKLLKLFNLGDRIVIMARKEEHKK